jgi:energy-coupling factor transport system permease protein
MSTRALACWSAAALVATLTTTNPVYRVLVVLVAANLLLARRRPGAGLRPLAFGLAVAGVLSVLLNLALAHTGRDMLLTLPAWVPAAGGAITLESAVFGAIAALGLAGAVLAVAPLSLLREPAEVVAALPRPLTGTGTALAAALNLVPALARSFTSVRDAQRMRGWRPRGPASWADLLVPVVLTALEDSVQLAESMEARAYGAGRRTRLPGRRWTVAEGLVGASAVLTIAAFALARVVGWAPDWYPYPALTIPPVSPLLVAACLLLAVPLLTWRSPTSIA